MVPVVVGLAAAHAAAVTRYVDDDSADPQSPYTNAAHAAVTIQEAIDVSETNDLILGTHGRGIFGRD